MRATEFGTPLAVVTGGSRGIGASTCRDLVARGFAVVFCYREKERRANSVVSSIRAHHRDSDVRSVRADITTAAGRRALTTAITTGRTTAVDVLVLNAAGGMEHGTPAGYAELVNADAQVAVVDELCHLMAPNAAVLYLTSLQSHRYGSVPEFDSYRHIAASKHRGEQLLRERFSRYGCAIPLHVVVSDMVDGSPAAILMDLREPEAAASRRREAAARGTGLPTVEDVTRTVSTIAVAAGGRTTPVEDRRTRPGIEVHFVERRHR